jgi:hypothetical protein
VDWPPPLLVSPIIGDGGGDNNSLMEDNISLDNFSLDYAEDLLNIGTQQSKFYTDDGTSK